MRPAALAGLFFCAVGADEEDTLRRLPFFSHRHLKFMSTQPHRTTSEIFLRVPVEPQPPPIHEPPSPPENPDLPLQDPQPEDLPQI
jgi:hypothetical protein